MACRCRQLSAGELSIIVHRCTSLSIADLGHVGVDNFHESAVILRRGLVRCETAAGYVLDEVPAAFRVLKIMEFHDEFLELFDHAMDACPDRFGTYESVEKNRGRFERRKCIQTDYVEWFQDAGKWKGFRSVILVESERMTGKGVTTERRLYTSSLPMNPERALKCVRQHWGIENGLHWTMDVIFGEDRSRFRLEHGPENMSIFRHILVSVLKQKARRLAVSIDTLCAMAIADKTFLLDLAFGKGQ